MWGPSLAAARRIGCSGVMRRLTPSSHPPVGTAWNCSGMSLQQLLHSASGVVESSSCSFRTLLHSSSLSCMLERMHMRTRTYTQEWV